MFWFRIGCTERDLGTSLASSILAQGKLKIKGSTFLVVGVRDTTPGFVEGPIIVHTLSPILLRDPATRHCLLSPVARRRGHGADSEYGKLLEKVANDALRREVPWGGPIRIGTTLPGKTRKRSLHGSTVYAQMVRFIVDGSPQALRHLLVRGVGWSRSQGFGFLALDRSSYTDHRRAVERRNFSRTQREDQRRGWWYSHGERA